LILGVLDQRGFNRAERKNTVLTREQQKNRPIEEKEGNRWLETMENADRALAACCTYGLFGVAIRSVV
jgi:hypothetical protein